jgi:hypothetical protein
MPSSRSVSQLLDADTLYFGAVRGAKNFAAQILAMVDARACYRSDLQGDGIRATSFLCNKESDDWFFDGGPSRLLTKLSFRLLTRRGVNDFVHLFISKSGTSKSGPTVRLVVEKVCGGRVVQVVRRAGAVLQRLQ